jgi:hypothetical protein
MRKFAISSMVLAALTGACSAGPSAEELHSAARSLLPDGVSTVAEVEGLCVELAPAPSCVHIYFVPATRSMPGRIAEIENLAVDAGWTVVRKEPLPGGTQLQLEKPRVQAMIYLQPSDDVTACQSSPRRRCADAVLVEGNFGS